jgi:hypothetical protein
VESKGWRVERGEKRKDVAAPVCNVSVFIAANEQMANNNSDQSTHKKQSKTKLKKHRKETLNPSPLLQK